LICGGVRISCTNVVLLLTRRVFGFQYCQFFRRRNVNHANGIVENLNFLNTLAAGVIRRVDFDSLNKLVCNVRLKNSMLAIKKRSNHAGLRRYAPSEVISLQSKNDAN